MSRPFFIKHIIRSLRVREVCLNYYAVLNILKSTTELPTLRNFNCMARAALWPGQRVFQPEEQVFNDNQCDKCATKFRLDDSRITPSGVKVRCTKCDNVFIVTPPPPPEEVQVEELFGVAPGTDAGGLQPKAPSPKQKEDDRHLSFDFDNELTREDIFKTRTAIRTTKNSGAPGLPGARAAREKTLHR
jgi:predicted Zn finger-like uncharacterized protein